MDRFVRIRFAAKAVLAAGYYVYGELFRSKADHHSLRNFLNNSLHQPPSALNAPGLRLYDEFSLVEESDVSQFEVLKYICKYVRSSCVLFGLGQDNVVGTVGILGEFTGMVNFKADAGSFPNEGDYRLGHIVYFKDGKVVRKSFYDVVVEIAYNTGILKPAT